MSALFAFALVVPGTAAAQDPCPGALLDSGAPARATLDGMLCEVNLVRERHDLRPVRYDLQLILTAWFYAGRMATENFFSHESPEGGTLVTRLEQTKWLPREGWIAHEVLGRGCGDGGSARSIVRAWLNSRAHRLGLLAPNVSVAGIGVASMRENTRCEGEDGGERVWAMILANPGRPVADASLVLEKRAARARRARKRARAARRRALEAERRALAAARRR